MKVIIERRFDKLGDEYLQSETIQANFWADDKCVIIEFDKELYIIPKVVFMGIMQ